MTLHEMHARVVAHAIRCGWPMHARLELAEWLATSDDESIRSLAYPARHYERPEPLRVFA